ncbi:MAG: DUF3237 domain-containing protein [Gemmobacter sp.]
MTAMLPLETRPLLILSVDLAPAQALGATPQGDRKIVPVLGGRVEGRVTGRVLSGGGDWALTRADGVLMLDVRLTVEAADGGLIHVTYTGMRHGPAAVMARLAAGERVDPSEMYFRIIPRFETAAPAHVWLNRILAVGVGERLPAGPRYHVHEVL